MKVRDYNGEGKWSKDEIIRRYSQYCLELKVLNPIDLSPVEHLEGEVKWVYPVMDKVIAGIVLFVFETAVHAQYIASDNKFQHLRPLNAVVDYIVQWSKKCGYKYFNFGTANENDGKKINYGLFKFKEGFGGRGVLRER